MKKISNLNKAFTNIEASEQKTRFFEGQFKEFGKNKNILFVDPQLSGRQLYKTFLPYIGLFNTHIHTALTSIGKYNPKEQLISLNTPLSIKQIVWADFIVFPMTTENLTLGDTNIYNSIKMINKNCSVCFSVDFNYYELSDKHPYKEIFHDQAIRNVEDNIWYSDICITTNVLMRDTILERMREMNNVEMSSSQPTTAAITTIPFFINSSILLESIDYEGKEPQIVDGFVPYDDKKTIEHINDIPDVGKPKEVKNLQIKVMKEGDKWVLKKGKSKKAIEVYATKSLAESETKKWIEKKYDIIIFKQDGTIQKSIIYKHQKN